MAGYKQIFDKYGRLIAPRHPPNEGDEEPPNGIYVDTKREIIRPLHVDGYDALLELIDADDYYDDAVVYTVINPAGDEAGHAGGFGDCRHFAVFPDCLQPIGGWFIIVGGGPHGGMPTDSVERFRKDIRFVHDVELVEEVQRFQGGYEENAYVLRPCKLEEEVHE